MKLTHRTLKKTKKLLHPVVFILLLLSALIPLVTVVQLNQDVRNKAYFSAEGETNETAYYDDSMESPAGESTTSDKSQVLALIDTFNDTYWKQQFGESNEKYQSTFSQPVDDPRYEYARSDGSIVSWVDSRYALPAYIDMYYATRDTKYIGWLIERINTILTYKNDKDGNGTVGWPSAQYSDSLLENGSFEGSPDSWKYLSLQDRHLTLPEKVSKHTVPISPGLCTNSFPSTNLESKIAQLQPGTRIAQPFQTLDTTNTYRLQLVAKLEPSDRIMIRFFEGSTVVFSTTISQSQTRGKDGWQQFSQDIPFTAAKELLFSIDAVNNNTNIVQIDNVLLQPYQDMFIADMHMASVMAETAYIVKTRPSLVTYTDSVSHYVGEAEVLVNNYQKWWRTMSDGGGTYLLSEKEPFARPYNHVAPAGEALLLLGKLTTGAKSEAYKQQAVRLATAMHQRLFKTQRATDGLAWYYMDDLLGNRADFRPRIEDIRHAGNNVPFIRMLNEDNLVFTRSEMRKIVRSFTSVWNGEYENPIFFNYIDQRSLPMSTGSFPLYRHLSMMRDPQLQHVYNVMWASRMKKVKCIQAAASISNGVLMSIPAVMLRYSLPTTVLPQASEAEVSRATAVQEAFEVSQ